MRYAMIKYQDGNTSVNMAVKTIVVNPDIEDSLPRNLISGNDFYTSL